jgi:hypothetical protein
MQSHFCRRISCLFNKLFGRMGLPIRPTQETPREGASAVFVTAQEFWESLDEQIVTP